MTDYSVESSPESDEASVADLDSDLLAESANRSRELIRQLDRSIRASVAAGARHNRERRVDTFKRSNDYASGAEERLYDLGYELGTVRLEASDLLRNHLVAQRIPFFAHFQGFLILAGHINHQAASRWRRNRRAAARLNVLGELHSHALLVADEVVGLLSIGYPSGALARWRTLYELRTIARLIGNTPLRVAQRYRGSHIVEQWLEIERGLLEDHLNNPRRRSWAESYIAQVERRYRTLVQNYGEAYGRPYGWAAEYLGLRRVRFSDIEEEVRWIDGRTSSRRYMEASQYIHGARLSAVRTLTEHPDLPQLHVPAWANLLGAHWDIIWSVNDITTELVSAIHASQGVEEAWYWSAAAYTVALDAATAASWSPIDVNPGYLNSLLAFE